MKKEDRERIVSSSFRYVSLKSSYAYLMMMMMMMMMMMCEMV
jgi:hypothetical protein